MYDRSDWGPSGTYSRDADGKWIWRYNKNDGHGGHGPEHRREMEQIAEQIAQQKINDIIPEIQRAAYSTAYNDMVDALSFDVGTAVNIGFANGEAIFKDKKTQKVVADAVMKEIRKQLKRMT